MVIRAPLLILAAAALSMSTDDRSRSSDWPLAIRAVVSPARGASGQPQLTTSDRGVLLSWIERNATAATLKYAERTASGWSSPVTVASGSDWFVNWADVPSVLRLDDSTLAAHWLQKSGTGTYAYDVRLSFSHDGGKHWSPPVTPHDDGTKTEHGFVSLIRVPAPRAALGLAWLDGRAMAGGGHGHASGAMSLRFATYAAGGRSKTGEAVLDQRVCECCPTSAAVTADGPIVAFRNRGDDEVRDIQVSRLENGRWTEPASVHQDGWKIGACPVNGPALSARGRDVAIAWFSARDDQPRAFVAFSRDAGRSFGAPIRLDDEASLGRVDVELLPDGSAAASHIEYAGGRPRFTVRRIDRSGARLAPVVVSGVEDGRASGYPRMALHGSELVFAWLDRADSARPPVVKTAVAALPR